MGSCLVVGMTPSVPKLQPGPPVYKSMGSKPLNYFPDKNFIYIFNSSDLKIQYFFKKGKKIEI